MKRRDDDRKKMRGRETRKRWRGITVSDKRGRGEGQWSNDAAVVKGAGTHCRQSTAWRYNSNHSYIPRGHDLSSPSPLKQQKVKPHERIKIAALRPRSNCNLVTLQPVQSTYFIRALHLFRWRVYNLLPMSSGRALNTSAASCQQKLMVTVQPCDPDTTSREQTVTGTIARMIANSGMKLLFSPNDEGKCSCFHVAMTFERSLNIKIPFSVEKPSHRCGLRHQVTARKPT